MLTVRFYDIQWESPVEGDYSSFEEFMEACDDFTGLPVETVIELDDDYHAEYDVEGAADDLADVYGFYAKSVKVEWVS